MNVTGSPLSLKGWLIVGLIVLSIVALIGWRCSAKRAETANTDRRVAEAQVEVHEKAGDLTADQTQAERENADLTRENREDIMEADNANDSSGEVGRAQLRALCRRRVYVDQPQCVELRRSDRAQPQG